MSIFQRIRDVAFNPELKLLPHVHVLDLAKTGYVQLPDLNATINCKIIIIIIIIIIIK